MPFVIALVLTSARTFVKMKNEIIDFKNKIMERLNFDDELEESKIN